MNVSYQIVRAIRGPLLLLTLGLLFFFEQSNLIDFERTWPILFIVYGVMKLIERLLAPPPPPRYYPPPAPPAPGPWRPPTPGGSQP